MLEGRQSFVALPDAIFGLGLKNIAQLRNVDFATQILWVQMEPLVQKYKTATELAQQLKSLWPSDSGVPYVVFTGGEPTLQVDEELIQACHAQGFEIGMETNGTRNVPDGVDWICVSPNPEVRSCKHRVTS